MTTLKMPRVDRKILKDREKIIKDISGFTNPENILTEREELKPYETDGLTAYKQTPMLVVLPKTTQEGPGPEGPEPAPSGPHLPSPTPSPHNPLF